MIQNKEYPCIVRGNDFTLKIPLFLTADGETAPFEPAEGQVAVFVKSSVRKYAFPFTLAGNELSVTVTGNEIENGLYGVEITVNNAGNMRSYTLSQFRIVESDDLASIPLGVEIVQLSPSILVDYGAGFFNYERAVNKPEINSVELTGNKTLSELGVQPAGDYLTTGDISTWAKQTSKPSYTKSEIGLGNVDNTADADKPISTTTQQALNTKEPIISSKLSAFNKSFGSTAGTVCEGNDARLSNTRPASDVSTWAKQPTKPAYTAAEVGALSSNTPLFSGAYNDLTGKPVIPTTPQQVGAEPAQTVNTISGAAVTLTVQGGSSYLCGTLTALTLTVEDSSREAVIRFASGATATTLTLPSDLLRCGYWGIAANRSYEISIANNLAVLVCYE